MVVQPGTIEDIEGNPHDLLVRFALFNNHHFFLFWFIRENQGLIAGLIKGNQRLISPY